MNLRFYFWAILVLSAILLLAPLRTGDLPGYDDALYAHIAKDILRTGDWINIRSNGYPALEHPPLLAWSEAALFSIFGVSDAMARLPAALSGLGVIALVYWLAKKLLRDRWLALLAMFVMATSVYFLKYAAHAMTDVPFTFLFLCAVSAWVLAEEDPRWYLVAGLFTALAGFHPVDDGILAAAAVRRRLPGPPQAASLALDPAGAGHRDPSGGRLVRAPHARAPRLLRAGALAVPRARGVRRARPRRGDATPARPSTCG